MGKGRVSFLGPEVSKNYFKNTFRGQTPRCLSHTRIKLCGISAHCGVEPRPRCHRNHCSSLVISYHGYMSVPASLSLEKIYL